MNKKVTVKDVAKLSGFSTATVSRVLTNHSYVKKSTRDKVNMAIKELGFEPNEIARSLIMQETKMLGLIVDDISNPFFSEISKEIMNVARSKGYDIIIYDTNGDEDNFDSVLRSLLNKRVAGILIGSVSRGDTKCKELVESGFPVVLFNRYTDQKDVFSVTIDNELAANLAVKHLVQRGHKNIAFLSGPLRYSTFHDRHRGFTNALKEFGLMISNENIYDAETSNIGIHRFVNDVLKREDHPTAFIAASDQIAITVLDSVNKSGFKIPEGVSVIGFDNIGISENPYIGLTTVSQQKVEMAKAAVEGIINLAEEKDYSKWQPFQIKLEPKLIVRKTT